MLSTSFTCVAASQSKPTSNNWGVVYSSDNTLDTAKYEINRLPIRLPQYSKQAKLFKRKNWFVSVVLFSNAEEAKKARNVIDNEYSRGVFVVDIREWCRSDWTNPKYTKVGIIDCNKVEIASNKTGAIITNIDKPINDLPKAKDLLKKTKDTLDKLINSGDSSGFINIEKDVTIFQKGKYFYIAMINYVNQQSAQNASVNAPAGVDIFNDVRTGAIDVKSWCNPKSNVPNKQGYIECKKLN